MKGKIKKINLPFYIAICFVISVISVELLSLLLLNNGHLVYTLDDAYIHMALSENIWNGHYGINSSEFSAPSSSILWPFIIAPFSSYSYFPFVLNVVAATASAFFIVKILYASYSIENKQSELLFISATALSLILSINLIGLPFNGMEHSLQVLFVILIAYGLIMEAENREVTWWFLGAIIAAPLIRYECMAISLPVLIYLLRYKYLKSSLLGFIVLVCLVGGFTVFLISLGLDPLPQSVTAKSSVVESEGNLITMISNLRDSLVDERQGIIMSFGMLSFFLFQFFSKDKKRKELAIVTVVAVLMHFMAGKFGSYYRYEIYIWSFMLLMSFYIFAPLIENLLKKRSANHSLAFVSSICLMVCLAGLLYIHGLFTLPLASNNIYEQQYQMHRFAVNYYDKPIAINDLGYVSYQNDNYVLDLVGLGFPKIDQYKHRRSIDNWMDEASIDYNVGLAMIYRSWFDSIPDKWIKIGTLNLSRHRVTPADSEVIFFATRQAEISDIYNKLQLFTKTLPTGVNFQFEINLTDSTESPDNQL